MPEGKFKLRLHYGQDNIWSDVYETDDRIIISDHNICTYPTGAVFDYDLYTQSQNRLMKLGKPLYRYMEGDESVVTESGIYKFNSVYQRIDATPVEHFFEERFAECYGQDTLGCLHKEYPIVSTSGNNLFLDYAVELKSGGVIAVEENGVNYHHPQLIGEERYRHQLEKQNICSELGIRLYRFSSIDCQFEDRIKEEILKFFGSKENFRPAGITGKRYFELYDHQKFNLEALEKLRKEHPDSTASALIVLPTATGKTMIILEDLTAMLKEDPTLRVIAVGPSRAIANQWQKLFKERNFPSSFETGTYQALFKRRAEVPQDYYDYIIIDEAHHAVAPMASKAITYFRPKLLVGLTATAERLDGKKLESIFGEYTECISLEDAMQKGIISPVRVYRINTNIDLSKVRYKGRDFVNADVEKTLRVPSRDKVIADTLKKYFNGPEVKGIIFCVDIAHAERISKLLSGSYGLKSIAVSSKDRKAEEHLKAFQNGEYNFICTCSLINEGWDEPSVNLIVMARPTLSKVLYTQQLGRGLRKAEGKECVYVLDVVDEYGTMLRPWSVNAIFSSGSYVPFGILGEQYRTGDIITINGYKETVTSIEELNLKTFESLHESMLSVEQSARELFINTGTFSSWIRKGKAVPDLTVPLGSSKLYFFTTDNLNSIRAAQGLKEHSDMTIKEDFFDFIKDRTYTFSFKIVFYLSLLDSINENGEADIDVVLEKYREFYLGRIRNGLPVDRSNCVYTSEYLENKTKMKESLLTNPFEKFERKRFIFYGKDIAMLSFNPVLWDKLSVEDIETTRKIMDENLKFYYENI